ncbi:MAG: two-component sensor histidine kinase [Deltaproteobacteria bacterium]|nr:two-component sensor histidine kinase [Deltaproteobacteria bacterium]
MGIMNRLVPDFWKRPEKESDGPRPIRNYRRMWLITVVMTVGVSIVPLAIMAIINLYEYHRALASEMVAPLERLTGNSARSVSFFISERKSALRFVVSEHSAEEMASRPMLGNILVNLKRAFGGFIDIGLIDSDGSQHVYVGPYNLTGKNYKNQEWFKETVIRGEYVSEVFKGYRNYPHFIIAVRHEKPNGDFFILRATIDTDVFNELARSATEKDSSDAFIVSLAGRLQTPSRLYGPILGTYPLALPPPSEKPETVRTKDGTGRRLTIGYHAVVDSPFVFVLAKTTPDFFSGWVSLRKKLVIFFILSVLGILCVVLAVFTKMVARIYEADKRREVLLHKAEYTNKLASLGRLAAGVAHEINNPLAIIGEKTGLLKDMMMVSPDFPHRAKVTEIADSVMASVERCSVITHRLLGFARHIDVKTETLYLEPLVKEVLGFLDKESQYRNIKTNLVAEEDLPAIESDRGQLQQVFLNIINNAFAAVEEGGNIGISISRTGENLVAIKISDDGCGISRENIKRIFEPFFSTKGRKGTGLGLSITYGIVKKLGGNIEVESQVGLGTTFTITLPIKTNPVSKT